MRKTAILRVPLLRLAIALLVAGIGAAHWQFVRAESVIHVVQPNENLFRIGLNYGVSWVAIMEANGLTSTTIYVGQELVIPMDAAVPVNISPAPDTEMAATPAPAATPSTLEPVVETPTTPVDSTLYTVQPNDTLFQIAVRYGLAMADIAAANNLSNPSLIYAGQTLVIPASGALAPLAPVPGANSAQKIVVDISDQHLYAYENDGLVYSFVVSTGMAGSDTWTGTFSVLDKIPSAYGANWDIWMPNWLGIYWAGYLEDGIHALPILSNGERLWEGFLGTPVSYGCIILGVDDSQTLYDWAQVGTPVYIQP